MLKHKFFFIFLIFAVNINTYADGNTFYVSPSGSDSNSGSYQEPFSTINESIKRISHLRSMNKMRGNVKLVLQEGKYHLLQPILITNNEWNGKDTLIIEGEENAIITGGVELRNKSKISDELWSINLSDLSFANAKNIQQLYVNGKRTTRARTPNLGEILFRTVGAKQYPNENSNYVTHHVRLSERQFEVLLNAKKDLNNIMVSFNHKWVNTQGYIKGLNTNSKTFTFTSPYIDPIINLEHSSQFYFENSIEFLDVPGEWILNSDNTLSYFPHNQEVFSNTIFEIPILSSLLNIKGNSEESVENIIFRNIVFQQTKYTTPMSGRTSPQAGNYNGASINVNFAQNIVFDNCEIMNIGDYGIWFKEGCKNNVVENCYIHDLGSGGIKIGDFNIPKNTNKTSHIIVNNNIIHSGGYEIPTGVGILIMHSGDNVISYNDIADFRNSGISVGWIWGYKESLATNNTIIYNHVHHLGWGELSDFGGIYTLGPSNLTEIKNNVIHDIYSYDFRGWGIYLDEGSSNILIENNLVYNCKSAGFHQHYGRDNVVKNNIFANQLNSQLEVTRVETHNSFNFTNNIVYYETGKLSDRPEWQNARFKSDSNLYWDGRINSSLFYNQSLSAWIKKTGKDKNSVIADPLFVDVRNNNYNFRDNKNINKINFIPFDYTKSGVNEKNKWFNNSQLDVDLIDLYESNINQRKLDEANKK